MTGIFATNLVLVPRNARELLQLSSVFVSTENDCYVHPCWVIPVVDSRHLHSVGQVQSEVESYGFAYANTTSHELRVLGRTEVIEVIEYFFDGTRVFICNAFNHQDGLCIVVELYMNWGVDCHNMLNYLQVIVDKMGSAFDLRILIDHRLVPVCELSEVVKRSGGWLANSKRFNF